MKTKESSVEDHLEIKFVELTQWLNETITIRVRWNGLLFAIMAVVTLDGVLKVRAFEKEFSVLENHLAERIMNIMKV